MARQWYRRYRRPKSWKRVRRKVTAIRTPVRQSRTAGRNRRGECADHPTKQKCGMYDMGGLGDSKGRLTEQVTESSVATALRGSTTKRMAFPATTSGSAARDVSPTGASSPPKERRVAPRLPPPAGPHPPASPPLPGPHPPPSRPSWAARAPSGCSCSSRDGPPHAPPGP